MKKRKYIVSSGLIGLTIALLALYWGANRPSEIRRIVLISIDTCRADYLSCYGFPRNTTPNIDAVAEQATLFEHVVSPAPITLPAHCSMLTGTIPPSHGVHDNAGYRLKDDTLTLAEILRDNGYDTTAIISAFVLDKARGMDQGFNTYLDTYMTAYHNCDIGGNERKGDETTDLALQWLDRIKDTNAFLFLHYYDPHGEYNPPEPFYSIYENNLYAGEIAFTDHCIGRVIQRLKELDLYDSTLLIITADHGEMLGEHGEDEHTYFIYESAIRVPLIVKRPGQSRRIVVSEPVGLVDLLPMVCSLLDIPPPEDIQGQDISFLAAGDTDKLYERFVYSESVTPTRIGASALRSLSTGRWKFIRAPRPELYDLTTDPGEKNNLAETDPHRVRLLDAQLQRTLAPAESKVTDGSISRDVESIKRLKSLGYISGTSDGEMVFDASQDDPKDLVHVYVQFHKARKLCNDRKYDKARSILEELMPQRPDFHEIHIQLGDIAAIQGDFDEAVTYYRSAVRLDPTNPMLMSNLAWLQATRPSLASRDLDEALQLAEQLCRQTEFRDPNALDVLSVVYAADGDFTKAAAAARQALNIATTRNDTVLAENIAERLELFDQSRPYINEHHIQ